MNNLFDIGSWTLHSGSQSNFKIDCDALTDVEIEAIAEMLNDRLEKFKAVIGIPSGGSRLANELDNYCTDNNDLPVLIVDDVLTTGKSMDQYREIIAGPVIGAVIFARGPVEEWITPLFRMEP